MMTKKLLILILAAGLSLTGCAALWEPAPWGASQASLGLACAPSG